MRNICHNCIHYILEYSHIAQGYVEGCDAPDHGPGCRDSYEPRKKKTKATIRRRGIDGTMGADKPLM